MWRFITILCSVALLALATPVMAQQAKGETPEQIVQGIANQLDRAVVGHQAELRQDKAKLIQTINKIFLPHFDVDFAAILVLGRHARSATPEQRQRFAKAFYKSIVNRYAEGLLDYTKGAVKVLPARGKPDERRTIVRSVVKLDNGKDVSVDYAFRKTRSGQWKVYDVIIEGISYISNYRNQVDAEIRQIGLDKLIQRLETQGINALPKQGG